MVKVGTRCLKFLEFCTEHATSITEKICILYATIKFRAIINVHFQTSELNSIGLFWLLLNIINHHQRSDKHKHSNVICRLFFIGCDSKIHVDERILCIRRRFLKHQQKISNGDVLLSYY